MLISIECDCCCCCRPRRPDGAAIRIIPSLGPLESAPPVVDKTPEFQGGPVPPSLYRRHLLMASEIPIGKRMRFTPKFVDAKGNPAKVDGTPTYLTDNTDLLALEPTDDGLSCLVTPVGALGSAKLTMRADADMGAGVVDLFGVVDITVTAGQAVSVVLDPGPVEDAPA